MKDFAAALPNGQLTLVQGGSEQERWNKTVSAVAAFFSDGRLERFRITPPTAESAEVELPTIATPAYGSGTAIILFADIADSTALTERLGDTAFRAKARELGPALRALVRECGGTPVEGPTLGDGVLAVFTSAREAIQAAQRCAAAHTDAGLPLHLGLHAGDATREKDPTGATTSTVGR